MKILNLLEKRRNADHPSQSRDKGFAAISKYIDQPLYATFTTVPKVGINPQSTYNTPIGIYTYSTKYIGVLGDIDEVPFAGESDNIYIIKPTVEVLYLSKYANLEADKVKLNTYLNSIPEVSDDWKSDDKFDRMRIKSRHPNDQASIMWQIVRRMAILLAEVLGRNENVMFNMLLKKVLGYQIIDDDEGYGIIHPAEEFQCVFLSTGALTVVDKIKNKHSGENVRVLEPSRQVDLLRRTPEYKKLRSGFDIAYKTAFADTKAFVDSKDSIMATISKSKYKTWDNLDVVLTMLDMPGFDMITFINKYYPLNYNKTAPKYWSGERLSNAKLAELQPSMLLAYDNKDKIMPIFNVVVAAYKAFSDINDDRLLSQLNHDDDDDDYDDDYDEIY